ncbi:MAG: AI-2E family transporter [Clostridiaceae bacterium]|nr:AI-2E family transporter [Clostridiaceae bacterium]
MKAVRWVKTGIPAALLAGFLFFIVFFGKEIIKAMVPLGIATAISYILLPVVDYSEKLKMPRTVGIIISILLSMVVILAVFVWIIPILANNISDISRALPELFNSVFNNIVYFVEKNAPDDWHNDIMQEINNLFSRLQQELITGLYGFFSILPETLSVIIDILVGWILSFYILRDKELIVRKLKYVFPEKYREEIICFLRDIHRVVIRFIQGQILIAVIIGIIETIGLYIAGIPYAPLLGMIGGISNVIPYFGPYIGAVPAVAVALTISPWKAALAIIVFVIVQQIDNIILSPRIIKGKLGLHPVTTIMSVLVGGRLFGFTGLVLAVPLTAMVKIILKKAYRIISG